MRALISVLVLATACGGATVTVPMAAENNSGESGTATLKDLGNNQTQVVISLSTGIDTGLQAAHIHQGTCANVGTIIYGLTSVDGGQSTSTVSAKLSDLQGGQYIVNVHNSVNFSTYVSCGVIP
jgi:hypothetical protein